MPTPTKMPGAAGFTPAVPWFDTHWGRSGAVISVHGEVGVADAETLSRYVDRCVGHSEWLVVDFSNSDLVGSAAAYSAMQSITDRCAALGVDWAVVLGGTALRLLRPCEADWAPRIGKSLSEVLATVHNRLHTTKPRRTAGTGRTGR